MPLQLTIICLTYYLTLGFFLFNPFYISVFQPFFNRANLFCLFFGWLSWKQDHHSEGGMNWEGNTDIYTLPCVKQTASKTLLHNTGSSAQCPVTDRWSGSGEGGSRGKEYAYTYTDSSEKAMATHSSTLAWKIPLTEEPGRLQSMGSLRVGHDWATSLSHWFILLYSRN